MFPYSTATDHAQY